MSKINKNDLKISSTLYNFINNEAIPGTGVNPESFWSNFSKVVHELTPINKKLIKKREIFQKKIDDWHISNKGKDLNKIEYINFLRSINYIVNEEKDFKIQTANVDNEITSIAGPQLVVPVDNARYALNAANARWGSLYNALYGTDVIAGSISKNWDKERAKKVISFVREFFDEVIPLQKNKWTDFSKIQIKEKKLIFISETEKDCLRNNDQFIGFKGDMDNPSSILFKNNNLHIEILIDPNTDVGKIDKAHFSDVIVESALSTIIDNEDSVAAVDAEDKVKCYKNWLGLMKGDLTSTF